ncbi:MAG: T9SS C-terminal target domain-containing protein, partial [Bacteroidetes bacterium]|nr:T9SS C-terminal target domain-containing protein [Bacteroidota bacterium]
TGTAQLRVKKTNSGVSTYQDITNQININQNEWTLLTGDYTHSQNEDSFLYVKGPSVSSAIGADFFIDNFSLVVAGSPEVDFSSASDIVDIGAYEYIKTSLSIYDRGNEIKSNHDITLFPNPVSNELHLINLDLQSKIKIIDVSGRKYDVKTIQNLEQHSIKIDLSHLKSGTYIIQILSEKGKTKSFKIMKQ